MVLGPSQEPPFLQSSTGFFTVTWRVKYNGYVSPVGFYAAFASTRGALPAAQHAALISAAAAASSMAAVASAGVATGTASAGVAAEIRAAVADPAVGTVRVTAQSLPLLGREIVVSGRGRVVSVAGACADPPCTLDAGSLSRHFRVTGGATLVLEGMRLVGGAARMGGSVLVEAGCTLRAQRSEIADSASVGAGGCVAAAAATVEVDASAHACRRPRLARVVSRGNRPRSLAKRGGACPAWGGSHQPRFHSHATRAAFPTPPAQPPSATAPPTTATAARSPACWGRA